MSIILDFADSFKTTEWTESINEMESQYGLINGSGLFTGSGTSEKAVVFDKLTATTTLLPQVVRGSKGITTGHEHGVETFSIPLAYFKHMDNLTAADIYRWRAPGTTDKETVARASAEKLQDIRFLADQMQEYLKCQALKGIFKTPDQTVVANMFTEFNQVQQTVDFDLDTNTTDVNAKIMELKRKVKAGLKTSTMNGIDVYVDEDFYDALVGHASMKSYYLVGDQASRVYREDTARYTEWGVQDWFEHKGVRFICYNPTFNLPSGSTEDFLASKTGIAVPRGARGLFRSYFGPSNKLNAVGEPGQEMYVRTYLDPRDEFVDFELEMAPLHFCTQPLSLVSLTTG